MLDRQGFLELPPIADLASWQKAVANLELGQRGGTRRLLQKISPSLIVDTGLDQIVRDAIGPDARLARAIFFDKTPETNWMVPWHQDLHLAVRERLDLPGYGPWSVKEGLPHVIPPESVLTSMLALRLHLDFCGADNGPLRVLPGSHRRRLSPTEVEALRSQCEPHDCLFEPGGILLMRPLLLHASSPATAPSHRRVVHLEYICGSLPLELAEL